MLKWLLSLFNKKSQAAPNPTKIVDPISLTNYLTANGRYPARANHSFYLEHGQENAKVLLQKVNSLLNELNVTNVDVTSGFRPPEVNSKTQGAAKASSHMDCRAVDILDDGVQSLARKISGRVDLLEKYELYMESPKYTIGKNTNWVHLQTRPTKNRIFIP